VSVLVSASIGLAFLPWIAGILAQAYGIGILFPYLLTLAVALLGLWFFLARPVSASEVLASPKQMRGENVGPLIEKTNE
jgi:fucose permease